MKGLGGEEQADPRVGPELHAEGVEDALVVAQLAVGQPESGMPYKGAADAVHLVEERDAVALGGEQDTRGDAGGPGAHDRGVLAVRAGRLGREGLEVELRDVLLDAEELHRLPFLLRTQWP